MSKKELMVIDTIWYKIYKFFRKIFKNRKQENYENRISIEKKDKQNFIRNISYVDEIEKINRKENIAEKLIKNEISVNDLTDDEVDEMIQYFNKYIYEMNQKLKHIKKYIIDIRNNSDN